MNKIYRVSLGVIFISIALVFLPAYAEDTQEVYVPYPIVFVHGIDPGNFNSWLETRNQFKKYFEEPEGSIKYEYAKYSSGDDAIYFPYCDYSSQNNGDITFIARTMLKNSIDKALQSFPDNYKGNRKVIIVAHSMGGLVLRSLLNQNPDYASKIEKTIFVDIPHLGSPLASGLWVLKEIKDYVLPPLIRENVAFSSLGVGSRYSLTGINPQAFIYPQLAYLLQGRQRCMDATIKMVDLGGPNAYGKAVEQLRLPWDVSYSEPITGYIGLKKKTITIIKSYRENDTYLAQNNLSIPSNKIIIRGVDTEGDETVEGFINFLKKGFESYFTFPSFGSEVQSLQTATTTGDGVVTKESQEGIGVASAENVITAFHPDAPSVSTPNILKAIDPAPQIERIRVIAEDEMQGGYATPYYVIIKAKEYLLADLEVVSIKLDGSNVFPGGIYSPLYYGDNFQLANPYKPYDELGKDFLKSRPGPKEGIQLEPGEFFIRLNIAYGTHELKIKLNNAANNTTAEMTYYISRPQIKDLYTSTLVVNNYTGEIYYLSNVIDVPPKIGEGYEWPYPVIDSSTKINFKIKDSLFNQFKISIGIFGGYYGQTLVRNLVPEQIVTLSGAEGNYYGDFEAFCVWDGKDDSGNYVTGDGTPYKIKIVAVPLDASYIEPPNNDIKQCLKATSEDYPNRDIINADPSFVQASREPQDAQMLSDHIKSFYANNLYATIKPNTIIDITDLPKQELIAKIHVPFPNSLVRADVPVFGLAYGKDFREYTLEYGKGANPTSWTRIITSATPQFNTRLLQEISSAGPTIKGNLGTWQTGLTEYEHNNKEYLVDLNGRYTLKLTVTDTQGNKKEDRVTVQVGRVASFAWGGVIRSPDTKVEFVIPEHSITDAFEVMGILPKEDFDAKNLYSLGYKITPAESFAIPATLKIKLNKNNIKDTKNFAIGMFDNKLNTWQALPSYRKGNFICAQINNISSSTFYAVINSDEAALQNNESKIATLAYLRNLIDESFDAKTYPIISFDYKISPGIKANLIAKVDNTYYDIQFTDSPKLYMRNNLKPIGKIDNVITDNNWRHAELNLLNMLSKFTSNTKVNDLYFADYDSANYMELLPGQSDLSLIQVKDVTKKQCQVSDYMVNFPNILQSVLSNSSQYSPCWQIGLDDNDTSEFNTEGAASEYYINKPFDSFPKAITPFNPAISINFNLAKQQQNKHYQLILDAISVDTSKKGYVTFQVLLNEQPIQTIQAAYWRGQTFQIPINKHLKEGRNTLTLKWLDGDNWVSWDYISFQPI